VNDWVCGNCKSINRGSANSCYSCGASREIVAVSEIRPLGAQPLAAQPLGAQQPGAQPLGAQTLAGADSQPGFASASVMPGLAGGAPGGAMLAGAGGAVVASEAKPRLPASANNILGGLLAGIVAAVLATALWYAVVVVSHYQLGIVAIVVGFLIGQAVVLGASNRGSIALVAVSVVLTLLALVISEYLIVANFVSQQLAPGETIELIQSPGFVLDIVIESVKADPLTLAFWAIALFQAFTIPARQLSRGSTT
jgi:hypothetical protein